MLYSQRALRQTLGEREQMLEIAYNLLEDWRSQLPTLLREMYKPDIHRILDYENLRYIALPMFQQYHEAIFMIFFPWTGDQASGDRVSQEWSMKGMELCVNSAHVVLATETRSHHWIYLTRKWTTRHNPFIIKMLT